MRRAIPLLLPLALAAACMRAPDPDRGLARPALPPGHPPANAPASPGGMNPAPGLSFEAPEPWTVKPDFLRNFYLVQYERSDAPGARLSISLTGGSVEQNLERWVRQFRLEPGTEAERGEREGVLGTIQTLVLRGTLVSTQQIGGGPERKDWALLGAAIPQEGGQALYVKVIGPADRILDEAEELWRRIEALRLEN